jgi:hypothetical protein
VHKIFVWIIPSKFWAAFPKWQEGSQKPKSPFFLDVRGRIWVGEMEEICEGKMSRSLGWGFLLRHFDRGWFIKPVFARRLMAPQKSRDGGPHIGKPDPSQKAIYM